MRYSFKPGMRVSDLVPEADALILPDYYSRKNSSVQYEARTDKVTGDKVVNDVKNQLTEINWDYAVIERLDPQAVKTTLIPFNLGKAIKDKDPANNIELMSGDVVTIFGVDDIPVPLENRTQFVRLGGEVKAPGIYQVSPGETLPQLVQRAGGLSRDAYLYGTVFSRESTRVQQQENLNQAIRRMEAQVQAQAATTVQNVYDQNNLANAQAQAAGQRQMLERLRNLKASGRIALEMDADRPELPALTLQDGDSITVPSKPSFVAVFGAVLAENSFIHRSNGTVGDYIDKAGPTREADLEAAMLIRGDGTVLSNRAQRSWVGFGNMSFMNTRLQPGDSIFIPEVVDRRSAYTQFIQGAKDWTAILYQFGIGAAALKTLCLVALWASMSLRFERVLSLSDLPVHMVVLSVGLAIPLFVHFGLYRAIFRYAGLNAIVAMGRAVGLYGLVFGLVYSVITLPGVPRSVGVMQPLLLLLLVGLSRTAGRYWLGGMYREMISGKGAAQVLIYGAGSAGRQLAAGLAASKEMRVVGYLDDDDRLHGQVLNGIRIHGVGDIPKLISDKCVTLVLLAIPSAGRERRNEILAMLGEHHLNVRTLPPLSDLVEGRVKESDIKELDLEDLLGRDPVAPNPLMMAKTVTGKTVMVTGAGGSIGSELCRQILRCGPRKLLLVELSEFSLYAIHQELERFVIEELAGDVDVIPLLASVRDAVRMGEILSTWKPETVYHAAAYKHVPLVEHNPAEGIRNNVFGTHTVASQSALHGVADFVLVSTDKAVRPTNVMGASKRLAEMVLQANAADVKRKGGQTRFSMVRFGNVLGSSGSVVPLFRQQIKSGGPITLTHADVTRYFMTIPEAAQLVIQAGAMASGGDVYVLDMGQPVKISDLARRMVVLSGLTVKDEDHPIGDIEIQVKGLRPGEKLYEELLIGDNPLPTNHPRIMKAHEEFLNWDELHDKLQALSLALDLNDVPHIRKQLKDLVPGYQPEGGVVDWVWMENERLATM